MRQVVVSDYYQELDIWPQDSFKRYLELTEEEVKRFFLDRGALVAAPCPVCQSLRYEKQFEKFGLNYVLCTDCQSLYVSPRPSENDLRRYYQESKTTQFWRTQIVEETQKARIGHLFRPRAEWVGSLTKEFIKAPQTLVDVSSQYEEFLKEIDSLNIFKEKIVLDPLPGVTALLGKQLKTVNKSITDLASGKISADVATAITVLNRAFDLESFLGGIRHILKDDGLLFCTASTISGFDLQTLWGNARTIFPPERLNLPSIEGLEKLFSRCGFEVIELSTPGQLDIEGVKNALKNDDKAQVSRFVSYLIENRGEEAHQAFQEFLQRFQLSSHVRIASRKR